MENNQSLFPETEMRRSAELSPCRRYRYLLRRVWDERKKPINFVGLNPSTADETIDDATIRKCMAFARSWNAGGIVMTNLFAWRARDPERMKLAADPVGEKNEYWLGWASSEASMVVAAWGNHGAFQDQCTRVLYLLRMLQPVYCLKISKQGQPVHPLYLPGDTQPFVYREMLTF